MAKARDSKRVAAKKKIASGKIDATTTLPQGIMDCRSMWLKYIVQRNNGSTGQTDSGLQHEASQLWDRLTDSLLGTALNEKFFASLNFPEKNRLSGAALRGAQDRARLVLALQLGAFQDQGVDRNEEFSLVILPRELAQRAADDLLRLSGGEVAPIFRPMPLKSYKDTPTIRAIRHRLLQCCHFLYGAGDTMTIARGRVAEAAGVDPQVVGSWQKAAKETSRGPDLLLQLAEFRGGFSVGSSPHEIVRRMTLKFKEPNDLQHWWVSADTGEPWPGGSVDGSALKAIGLEYKAAIKKQKDATARQSRQRSTSTRSSERMKTKKKRSKCKQSYRIDQSPNANEA